MPTSELTMNVAELAWTSNPKDSNPDDSPGKKKEKELDLDTGRLAL